MLGNINILQLCINEGLTDANDRLVCGETDVIRSASFPLPDDAVMGWELGFYSGGSIDVKVELEQGNVRPTTEGAEDANYVVPDDKTREMFEEITDSNYHIVGYSPDVTKFARLKITGLGANAATTALKRALLHVKRG